MMQAHGPPASSKAPSKLLARIAVAGMSLAVASLGALAIWAAIVTQNGADGVTRAGVQTSGHLRAVQAMGVLDTQTEGLDNRSSSRRVEKLRTALRVLDDALVRMRHGGNRSDSQLADELRPMVRQLKPAVEQYRARPPGESERTEALDERMDAIIEKIQVLLGDHGQDPGLLIADKLAVVTATEHTVRVAALVLIPLGLGGAAGCGWLLSLYRRRSEAAMCAALDVTAREARTDELTGLPNRRALLEQLEYRCDGTQAFTLALADLNGFKRYNDTFGHPAGDALLRRLGQRLAATCEGRGIAARLGGDEFSVLFFEALPREEARALLSEVLSDEGEGFRITAASGVVAVPAEAGGPEAALRLADARMYANKGSALRGAEDATSEVMIRMLEAHQPGLGTHVHEVAALAAACATVLGLSAEEVQAVVRAAKLHDVGKVAIPSAILAKEGSLSDEEWDYMRRHSIVGERILAGVPSLEGVASVVRSSHERWDGRGYPDGLVGADIPLGARIVFIADAFCAMTERRPYAAAMSVEGARHELRACSGTQFDPAVLTAFFTALDRRAAPDDVPSSPAAGGPDRGRAASALLTPRTG